jgi:bacillithiol system protein YtxJ
MKWHFLTESNQLEQIIDESNRSPVLIFKHSTRCSISSAALDRLERNWRLPEGSNIKAYFIDLINHRSVSNEVSERFSIYHQSPQAILIFQGKVIYEESHFNISYDEIESHLNSLAA